MLNRRFQMFGYTDLEKEHGFDSLRSGPGDRFEEPENNTTCGLCGCSVEHESIDLCIDCMDFDLITDEESQLAKDESRFAETHMSKKDDQEETS